MMRRLFPSPLLSLALAALWLLLTESVSPGQLLLAVLLAIALPLMFAPLRPQQPRIRRPWVVLRLIGGVGRDVILSNLQIARDMLRLRRSAPRSAFVVIPLELRDPSALAALAVITTIVPGTVWCELARDASAVRLHVWDLADEAAFIAHYKSTYEAPLLEIYP